VICSLVSKESETVLLSRVSSFCYCSSLRCFSILRYKTSNQSFVLPGQESLSNANSPQSLLSLQSWMRYHLSTEASTRRKEAHKSISLKSIFRLWYSLPEGEATLDHWFPISLMLTMIAVDSVECRDSIVSIFLYCRISIDDEQANHNQKYQCPSKQIVQNITHHHRESHKSFFSHHWNRSHFPLEFLFLDSLLHYSSLDTLHLTQIMRENGIEDRLSFIQICWFIERLLRNFSWEILEGLFLSNENNGNTKSWMISLNLLQPFSSLFEWSTWTRVHLTWYIHTRFVLFLFAEIHFRHFLTATVLNDDAMLIILSHLVIQNKWINVETYHQKPRNKSIPCFAVLLRIFTSLLQKDLFSHVIHCTA
jgi:hypothetical protein